MRHVSDNTLRSRVIVAAGLLLPLLWMGINRAHVFGEQNGLIRAGLSSLLAALILFRAKPTAPPRATAPASAPTVRAGLLCLGACSAVIGILVPLLQAQWGGVLLVSAACLLQGLPTVYRGDIAAALAVLYWAAPFPTRFFTLLQTTMQGLSVRGTEWVLHMLNVRVWAEGMVLHSPAYTFEVPAWCSGMRTATTVFILAIGLGILKRIGLAATILTTLSALFYALALNILRIGAMVLLTASGDSEAHLRFLHDSTALVVLVAVFLVTVQTTLLRQGRLRRRADQSDRFADSLKVLSPYPPFWRTLVGYRHILAAVLAGLVVAGLLAWRSRPDHRTMMIRDVVLGMRASGRLETAQRAFEQVSPRIPDDDLDWKLTGIRLLLLRGRYTEVLEALDSLGETAADAPGQTLVLRAYALMALGQLTQAGEIVEQLPESIRHDDPHIAMIRAELARQSDDPVGVAASVMQAARWQPNTGRIRNLYPYLHANRQWRALAASAGRQPYTDPVQAFAVLEALMHLDLTDRMIALARTSSDQWPDDPRGLEPLYYMTLNRPEGLWEDRFSAHLHRCLPAMQSPDALYALMHKCDGLVRPDLLWAVHRRLQAIDPEHPALPMSIAVFGERWFRVRRRRIGLPAGFPGDTIDLRPYVLLARQLPHLHPLLAGIPHARALAVQDTQPVRENALREAVAAFARRASGEGLSQEMHYLYAYALEVSGHNPDAKAELAEIAARFPDEQPKVRIVLSELYERAGQWITVYELLRDYLLAAGPDDRLYLAPMLRLAEAQLHLRLGPAANFTARQALQRYPRSPQALALVARATALYDGPEEAFKWLTRPRAREGQELDLLEAGLLLATERFQEVSDFARQHGLPLPEIPPGTVQRTALPPAETAALWHHTAVPSERRLAAVAAHIRGNLPGTESPALQTIMRTWLEAYQGGCQGRLAAPAYWAALGRDRVEAATALHQLTILLCREERFQEARAAAEAAVAHLPEDPILQRALISLSGGDLAVVQAARAACPEHSDLWLAELVIQARRAGDAQVDAAARQAATRRIRDLCAAAVAEPLFSAGAMTRAAEFLLRHNHPGEAASLIRGAGPRARGLLPVAIMGLRCALREHDHDLALAFTRQAMDASLHPIPPLYEHLVALRSDNGRPPLDSTMVNALQVLRKARPLEPLWPELLGTIRFQRGGWEVIDALYQMQEAIDRGATGPVPYAIAAEVARLLRQYDRAEDLLRRGLELNPGDAALLNNLVYTLSLRPERAADAAALLPHLAPLAGDRIPILDTMAIVMVRAGEGAGAREMLARILRMVEPGSHDWFRAHLHLAELAWSEGRDGMARTILEDILRRSRGIPDEDILEANAMLAAVRENAPYRGAPTAPAGPAADGASGRPDQRP